MLEHSVLCGSDKYQTKEPFVDLLKGSLQTYLNAMTWPDRTVYPIASQNKKDWFNLADVYLDVSRPLERTSTERLIYCARLEFTHNCDTTASVIS